MMEDCAVVFRVVSFLESEADACFSDSCGHEKSGGYIFSRARSQQTYGILFPEFEYLDDKTVRKLKSHAQKPLVCPKKAYPTFLEERIL